MSAFMATPATKEKEKELDELVRIVLGIRLFNKETGNASGEGLTDIRTVVLVVAQQLWAELQDAKETYLSKISQYTYTIQHMHDKSDSDAVVQRCQAELAYYRQYHSCLTNLMKEIGTYHHHRHHVRNDEIIR